MHSVLSMMKASSEVSWVFACRQKYNSTKLLGHHVYLPTFMAVIKVSVFHTEYRTEYGETSPFQHH